jgi:hypothetical protein
LQLGRGIGAEFYTLADALVLRAIDEGERAVRAGAVGARAGVVGEDFALGAGELVAGGAGVDGVGGSKSKYTNKCIIEPCRTHKNRSNGLAAAIKT